MKMFLFHNLIIKIFDHSFGYAKRFWLNLVKNNSMSLHGILKLNWYYPLNIVYLKPCQSSFGDNQSPPPSIVCSVPSHHPCSQEKTKQLYNIKLDRSGCYNNRRCPSRDHAEACSTFSARLFLLLPGQRPSHRSFQ